MIAKTVSSKDFSSKGWTAQQQLGYNKPHRLAARRRAYAAKKARKEYEKWAEEEKLRHMTEALLK